MFSVGLIDSLVKMLTKRLSYTKGTIQAPECATFISYLHHGFSHERDFMGSIQRKPREAFRLIPNNPTYLPYTIRPVGADASGFEILRQVVCALKRL